MHVGGQPRWPGPAASGSRAAAWQGLDPPLSPGRTQIDSDCFCHVGSVLQRFLKASQTLHSAVGSECRCECAGEAATCRNCPSEMIRQQVGQ